MRIKNAWRRATMALVAAAVVMVPTVLVATPAQAAWGTQYSVTLQISTSHGNLGYADGWVQFDDAGNRFRYSLTVCRQSSYVPPQVRVSINAGWVGQTWRRTQVAYHHGSYTGPPGSPPCYGGSWTVSGEYTHSARFRNVEFELIGDTFVGSSHTTFTRSRVFNNPY